MKILVAGGVSANKSLRETFLAQGDFAVHIPPITLCTDNAAMIACAGYQKYKNSPDSKADLLNMDATASLLLE